MTQPKLYMIMGPNGAGKTTSAFKLLPNRLSMDEFVNADEVARGLSPFNTDGQSVAAGRLMLQRINDLIEARKSFAFETTGASHFGSVLDNAKAAGYRLGLVYLWLPSADLAKLRVRLRVAQGGHNISADDIERRYKRGLHNLINLYLPLADEASIFDSTLPITGEPELLAQKNGAEWQVYKPDVWDRIQKAAEESGHE